MKARDKLGDKLDAIDKKLMLDIDGKAVIQLVCSRAAAGTMMELLMRLKNLGDAGCSRIVHIEGASYDMFFDGDGDDKIGSITLNGRSLDEWSEVQKRLEMRKAKLSKPAVVQMEVVDEGKRSLAEDERLAEVESQMEQTRDIADQVELELGWCRSPDDLSEQP